MKQKWVLTHDEDETDEGRQQVQESFLREHPVHRLVSGLIAEVRRGHVTQVAPEEADAEVEPGKKWNPHSWWTPAEILQDVPIRERMEALRGRPDQRQFYTMGITNLPPNAARNLGERVNDQADLIELCRLSGDFGESSARTCDHAFLPDDLVCYMDPRRFWLMFMERYPWHLKEHSEEEVRLIAWLIRSLLAVHRQNGGMSLMSHLEILGLIPSSVWYEAMPTHLCEEVRDARLEAERNSRAFGPIDEMEIVTPEEMAAHIPHAVLRKVMEAAGLKHGLEEPEPATDADPESEEAPASAPAPEAASATMPSLHDSDVPQGPPVGRVKTPVPESVDAATAESRVNTDDETDVCVSDHGVRHEGSDADAPASGANGQSAEVADDMVRRIEDAGFGFKGLRGIGLNELSALNQLLFGDPKPAISMRHTLAMGTMIRGRKYPIDENASERLIHDTFIRMVDQVDSEVSAALLAHVQRQREASVAPPAP